MTETMRVPHVVFLRGSESAAAEVEAEAELSPEEERDLVTLGRLLVRRFRTGATLMRGIIVCRVV